MEPFRQKGSSMASWSTFIFKSVTNYPAPCIENVPNRTVTPLSRIELNREFFELLHP